MGMRYFAPSRQAFPGQRLLARSLWNSGDGEVFRWREVNLYIHVYIRFFVCGTLAEIGKAAKGRADPMMSLVENGCGLMMMRRGNIESSRVKLDLSSMSSRGFRPVVGGTFLRSIGTGELSTVENQFRRYFILSNTQSKPRGYQVPYPFGRREFYILLRRYDQIAIVHLSLKYHL